MRTSPKFVTFNLLDTIFTKLAELTMEHGIPLLSKYNGFRFRSFDFRYLTSSFIILMTMLALIGLIMVY